MTLTGPNTVILGDNTGAVDTKGSNIYSVVAYENLLNDTTQNLVIQYMLSTAKGMHSFISPLVFAPCTTLTPNT